MILTVTLNPALDLTYTVDALVRHATNRVRSVAERPGGKGVIVAWVLHAAGEPFDAAIAHAGRIRLRPILMTTFCTLFGLFPLALGLGAGAELQKPLALAVIGGLALSTPVTLLAVPGLYAAVKRRH